MKKVLMVALATGMLLLSACDTSTKMEVHEPWARATAQGDNGAVYMILHNHSTEADELVGASSDAAEAIEIHESAVDANGVMRMTQQTSISIPADQEIEFKPGGLHIMLVNLKRDLKVGEEIIVTLHFKNREDITLTVPMLDGPTMDGHNMP